MNPRTSRMLNTVSSRQRWKKREGETERSHDALSSIVEGPNHFRDRDFRGPIPCGLFIIAAVPFLLPDVSLPVWTVPAGQAQEVQATGFNASQSIPPITIAIWTWRVGVAFFLSWLAIQFVRLELKRIFNPLHRSAGRSSASRRCPIYM
jgi:hypothetical protein